MGKTGTAVCSTEPVVTQVKKAETRSPSKSTDSSKGTGRALSARTAQLGQVAFIVMASFFVYAFVATAKDGEARRACTTRRA